MTINPRTGRPYGDHGSAVDALNFALDLGGTLDTDVFLRCWREGNLDEWPEFYEWLERHKPRPVAQEPLPIETAPRDGTLFDAVRRGIRYTDCAFDDDGRLVRVHGYPSSTTVFLDPPTHWLPRPLGLLLPYESNSEGEKYVPR